MKKLSIIEINEIVQGEIIGDTDQQFIGPEQLSKATKEHISFIGNKKFIIDWQSSQASAAIVSADLEVIPEEGRAIIKVANADLAMAKLLEVFNPNPPQFDIDIHPNATIHKTAIIGQGCKIGAGCYIGPNTTLGENVIL